jgi:hypothetical protein
MMYQKPTRLSEQAHGLIEAYAKSIKALGVVPSTDHFYAVQSKRQALENYICNLENNQSSQEQTCTKN